MPQTLRSKLKDRGMLRLMPKTFALMAVQRQTAASRSRRPWIREQQGVTGGVPMTSPNKPLSKLAHTPSFRASLGHVAVEGVGVAGVPGVGVAGVPGVGVTGPGVGFGVGFGFGFGFGLGLGGQVPHAEVKAKKRRLIERKRASDADALEAISQNPINFVLRVVVN